MTALNRRSVPCPHGGPPITADMLGPCVSQWTYKHLSPPRPWGDDSLQWCMATNEVNFISGCTPRSQLQSGFLGSTTSVDTDELALEIFRCQVSGEPFDLARVLPKEFRMEFRYRGLEADNGETEASFFWVTRTFKKVGDAGCTYVSVGFEGRSDDGTQVEVNLNSVAMLVHEHTRIESWRWYWDHEAPGLNRL